MIFMSICLVALFGQGCRSLDKPILDRWETNATAFALRVTEFQEKGFALSKFRYVFEAKPNGSQEWSEIMSTITDDDVPIPRDQVRFINDRTADLFMTDKYAVTTNGGKTWSIWTANDHVGKLDYPGQFFIKEVLVNPDGNGTLVVSSRSADRHTMPFRTEDFGYTWVPK